METAELINEWAKKAQINIATDKLKVYLTLFTQGEDIQYKVEDIMELLGAYKITYGIDSAAIENAILHKSYYLDILIAQGLEPIDGEPGKFEFKFDIEENKKPIILEDGSVDYNTLGQMTLVKQGDLLAEYTKAQEGTDGIDIFGNVIAAKNFRELQQLKGKGFLISEDETEYTAAAEGKVEWKNERLNVMELLVIEEDVDATTGDIQFNGDVLVKGNVYAGTTIRAGKSITVNGAVEAANLFAGKGILLKNGMQGGGKGKLSSKEDISGKFFEQAELKAKGTIKANAIMNCSIESGADIIVSGKKGMIIGGITKAAGTITASYIGNRAEISTDINVGLDCDFTEAMLAFENTIAELCNKVMETDRSLKLITKQMQKAPNALLQDQQREILQEKIKLKTELAEQTKKREELIEYKEKSAGSKVIASKTIYVGTKITINGYFINIAIECTDVTLKQRGMEVCIYANG